MPLRVAAGLVAVTVEKAQQLPRQVVELPVTAVSQIMQVSMRVQQRITDLAIKGDQAISSLRPVEENPSWATFDDEAPIRPAEEPAEPVGELPLHDEPVDDVFDDEPIDVDPIDDELAADVLADDEPADNRATNGSVTDLRRPAGETATTGAPAGISGYDELSLAQLRARLRRLSVEQLTELLSWESAHQDRPAFVTMLGNRITTVTEQ